MKRLTALIALLAVLPLTGCIVAPAGPGYYRARPVVVAPVVVRPYGHYHYGYRGW
jgi:hypothetical protein